ncbi:MAG: PAS domain-containing protein [Candidatus Omnitrophica bacterium]|jgi:PAS domain S-box-containing protein|nr:PAS domain-containing protein [Candidatus Omnitrophota bacterium]
MDDLERRGLEDRLRKSHDAWDRTFNAISDTILIIDKNHTIVKANKAALDLLQKTYDQIVGMKCFEVMHKSNSPWHLCPLEKTNADHFAHVEEVNDPAIGFPLLVTTSPIFDENNEYAGVVHVAKDISERKKIEDELHKRIEALERFQRITVDRELKMKELKAQIVQLESQLKQR